MVVAPPLPRLPLVLAIFTATQLSRMSMSATLASLTEAKGKMTDDSIDGVPLVAGVACILRQFHASATEAYVQYLTQLVRAQMHGAFSAGGGKVQEAPQEACTLLQYLDLFSRHAGVDVPNLHLYQSAAFSSLSLS